MAHLKAINDSFSYNLSENLKISDFGAFECGVRILLMFFIFFFFFNLFIIHSASYFNGLCQTMTLYLIIFLTQYFSLVVSAGFN